MVKGERLGGAWRGKGGKVTLYPKEGGDFLLRFRQEEYLALYAGGRGGRPLCAGAAGGCAPFAGGYWLDPLGLLRAQRLNTCVPSSFNISHVIFCLHVTTVTNSIRGWKDW